jgi:hypothetical protein
MISYEIANRIDIQTFARGSQFHRQIFVLTKTVYIACNAFAVHLVVMVEQYSVEMESYLWVERGCYGNRCIFDDIDNI